MYLLQESAFSDVGSWVSPFPLDFYFDVSVCRQRNKRVTGWCASVGRFFPQDRQIILMRQFAINRSGQLCQRKAYQQVPRYLIFDFFDTNFNYSFIYLHYMITVV
jgi:hypothetical protein